MRFAFARGKKTLRQVGSNAGFEEQFLNKYAEYTTRGMRAAKSPETGLEMTGEK
jgi:hypothetical protein